MGVARRPLWLLIFGTFTGLAFLFLSDRSKFELDLSRWHRPLVSLPNHGKPSRPRPLNVGSLAQDEQILQDLQLGAGYEYRRLCFDVRPVEGLSRTSLEEVSASLLNGNTIEGLKADGDLLPCSASVRIDVPYFDPHPVQDTSELMLGVATTLKRIDESLPAMSRFLAYSGTPLLVLLLDVPDLNTSNDQITTLRAKAQALGIEAIYVSFQPTVRETQGTMNFALAEVLHQNRQPSTKWFGVMDDDTFFVSLPPVLDALALYNPEREWYVGALTEGLFRIAQEGFKAWGGAGFFVSPPLMQKLADNSERCRVLDRGWGDLLWRDCILEITSPPVKLTQMSGLHQIDLWGDVSGWYESGWTQVLTVHHWKSWHYHSVPLAHEVTDIAGPDSFLQRYLFDDNVVLTNGYSIVHYPNGLPDLNKTELTFTEEVNVVVKPPETELMHSFGATRPALKVGKDKISWKFEYSTQGSGGSVRTFYVKRGGPDGGQDSLIELDWKRIS
ncbi:glycosyltransferase family 31 protein [Baudoinia panamericana UAMH 10762]|uniref:Glycosyltransferase family 31 protein n=1 Tax=Baudoinia panamericana (strain UAMH 10762) TaxID=717646 RepID=M2LCJ7_BAUPA|nr:glycosyltransferase family 31 protein [Baudoinia panamericana UAMH 10762]EMC91682.1 glycosyltransferase family 31 protein [Baudoinia panamericana UAMH 10762]